jgi:4'-phosphopantetheinyl transferase
MIAGALPASGEVHLWHIALGAPERGAPAHRRAASRLATEAPIDQIEATEAQIGRFPATEALLDRLPPADARRAERIGHPAVRRRFVVCQTALRSILADYLALDPAELCFSEGPWGKPALAGPEAASGLAFNLTHSGALALLAVTRHREVGVDLELLRPLPDAQDLAERFFSAPERDDLRRVAGTDAEALTFFNCWTRKEAYIKALGRGMYEPLDGFAVSCLPGEPARLRWCREDAVERGAASPVLDQAWSEDRQAWPAAIGDPPALDQWTLVALEPTPGYVGAVATTGPCGITEFGFLFA